MTLPEQLLARFRELSGHSVTLSAMRMEVLAEMALRGFTPADVELVWRWVKLQIARSEGGYNSASLQFGALLGRSVADVDKFEDKLAVARQSKLGRTLGGRRAVGAGGGHRAVGAGSDGALPSRPVQSVPLPQISAEEEQRLREKRKAEVAKLKQDLHR